VFSIRSLLELNVVTPYYAVKKQGINYKSNRKFDATENITLKWKIENAIF
jgi:hypothetical protein